MSTSKVKFPQFNKQGGGNRKKFNNKGMFYVFGAFALLIALVAVLTATFKTVDSGYVGIKTYFGAVQGDILPEGLHVINPFTTEVIMMSVRIQKVEAEASASSKDLQNVTSKVALNYYLSKDRANVIFQELGLDYNATIILPTIQESIKSGTARFTAEELITKRPDVKQFVFEDIKNRLGQNNIIVTDFSIIDFDFSQEFNNAIEQKQIAEQRALTAVNDLNRIETEAKQQKAKAEGEAEARLALARAEAEAQRLLSESVSDDIIELKAIEKWDGVLPVAIGEGSNGAFFDVMATKKK